jgi:NCK adaptor protein
MADEAFAVALYDYHSQNNEELSIRKNDKLLIINDSGAWWQVQNERHQAGLVPSNYLQRTDLHKGKKIFSKIFSRKGSSGGPSDNTEPPGYEAPEYVSTTDSFTEKVDEAIAKYNYTPVREDEVALTKGDRVYVLEKEGDGWWRGEANGKAGWFPSNYVEIIKADKASNVICKVRTLYPFKPTNNEELHFEKDTLLEIIDQPRDDPEWWKARKEDGTVGLVPKNYVKILDGNQDEKQPVPNSPGSTPVAVVDNSILGKEWYHGNISRQECERKLNASPDGDFLVRASETKVRNNCVEIFPYTFYFQGFRLVYFQILILQGPLVSKAQMGDRQILKTSLSSLATKCIIDKRKF